MGRFSKKRKNPFFQSLATSGRHNSAVIIDRLKFIGNDLCTGCLVSIFTVGTNSKSFPWPAHLLRTRNLPKNFLRRRTRVDGTADNSDISQSQAASDDRLQSHVTLGRVECRK